MSATDLMDIDGWGMGTREGSREVEKTAKVFVRKRNDEDLRDNQLETNKSTVTMENTIPKDISKMFLKS